MVRSFHPARPAGFTLIELLIVVAIIAILAAIAVPNFLEAQTRSKVSRFMADLRSAATANEAYAVDHNTYPPADRVPAGSISAEVWSDPPDGAPEGYLSRRLTTPVAYLTTLPIDIFPNQEGPDPDHPALHAPHYSCDAWNARWYPGTAEAVQVGRTYTALEIQRDLVPSDRLNQSMRWFAHSHGVDGDHDDFESAQGFPTQYDPTNGTASDGDIFYFGPARGFTR